MIALARRRVNQIAASATTERSGTMSSQPTGPVQLDVPAFLMKDYELKINYFTNHLTRMWTRFGMFVTLESALVAVLIVQGSLSNVATQIALVEVVISAIWFLMGRHDRCLIRIYRDQITAAAEGLRELGLPQDYRDVIDVSSTSPGRRGYLFEMRVANAVPLLPAALPALLIVGWACLTIATIIA
jgi:hypothetical protein